MTGVAMTSHIPKDKKSAMSFLRRFADFVSPSSTQTDESTTVQCSPVEGVLEKTMSIQLDTWYTCPYGDFVIRATRFIYASYDRDGNPLVFGGTPEAVATMTPVHLESKSPGYDGKYDRVAGDAFVGGKL